MGLAVPSQDSAPSPGSCCLQRQTLHPEDNSEQDPHPDSSALHQRPETARRVASPGYGEPLQTLLRIIFVGPPFAECHSILTSKIISLSEYVLLLLLERSETASHITSTVLTLASNRIHFPKLTSVYSFFIIIL